MYGSAQRPLDVLAKAQPEWAETCRRLMARGDRTAARIAEIVLQDAEEALDPAALMGSQDSPHHLTASPVGFYERHKPFAYFCRRCLPHPPGTEAFLAGQFRACLTFDRVRLDSEDARCSRCNRTPQEVA